MQNRSIRLATLAGIGVLFGAIMGSSFVYAYSGGLTTQDFDRTMDGCNECHSGAATNPTATLTAALSINRGQTLPMNFLLTGGAAVKGGVNVSIDQDAAVATLSTGTNITIQVLNNGDTTRDEITHSAALDFTKNTLSVAFELQTAADTPCDTPVEIMAWGNSVDDDGGTVGDSAARAVTDVLITCPGDAVFGSGFE